MSASRTIRPSFAGQPSSSAVVLGQYPRAPVVHLEPLHLLHRMIAEFAPLDRSGEHAAERVEFPVDGAPLDRFGRASVAVSAPLPCQPIAFELLDPE
jgi:hypothetical protein